MATTTTPTDATPARVLPVPRPQGQDSDPRFTIGLFYDVAKALEAHGYPRVTELTNQDITELSMALFTLLYGPEPKTDPDTAGDAASVAPHSEPAATPPPQQHGDLAPTTARAHRARTQHQPRTDPAGTGQDRTGAADHVREHGDARTETVGRGAGNTPPDAPERCAQKPATTVLSDTQKPTAPILNGTQNCSGPVQRTGCAVSRGVPCDPSRTTTPTSPPCLAPDRAPGVFGREGSADE